MEDKTKPISQQEMDACVNILEQQLKDKIADLESKITNLENTVMDLEYDLDCAEDSLLHKEWDLDEKEEIIANLESELAKYKG